MKGAFHTNRILAFILLTIAYSCQKELNFENQPANGTLKDSSGICFPQILHGTFYNGITTGADSNYIEVKVNVMTTGSYSILTGIQNGFGFADSGVFKNVGINTIKLKATGTPVAHVPTNFTIRFDTSVCSLTINVLDSATRNGPLYNWKFIDNKRGITYKGIFENNYIYLLGSFNVLVLSTKIAQAPGDSTFLINIGLPSSIITPGTYATNDPPTGIVFRTFTEDCLYCAGGGLIPISSGSNVNINITDYDPSTKIVRGSFNGTTIDWLNEIAPIKSGEFTAVVK